MEDVKIVGFLCNWCCYAGADLAGVSRFQYPPSIRIIRVMCSGRVDPVIILDAFLYGADGVFVGGCHPGDCHYLVGNYYAEKKIEVTRRLLEEAGVEPRRLRLEWVSASEGERFSRIMNEFSDEIKALGPIRSDREALEAACRAAAGYRLRIIATKAKELLETGNKYGEIFTQHELDRLLADMVQEEYESKRILLKLQEPKSVKELAAELNMKPNLVLRHIMDLRRYELVDLHDVRDRTPVYIARKCNDEGITE